MINRGELRFNNWAYGSIRPKEPMQIKSIDSTICKLGEYLEDYNSIEPVPLTTEILIVFGFKYGKTGKKKDDSFVQFWDIRTSDHKHSFTHGFYFSIVRWWKDNKPQEFTFSHHEIRSDCKYVHQLQNLYYSLTQKELEINL